MHEMVRTRQLRGLRLVAEVLERQDDEPHVVLRGFRVRRSTPADRHHGQGHQHHGQGHQPHAARASGTVAVSATN